MRRSDPEKKGLLGNLEARPNSRFLENERSSRGGVMREAAADGIPEVAMAA